MGKRVVPAGIHYNYIHAVSGPGHLREHFTHIHRLVYDLAFVLNGGVHGNEVVVSVQLHSVSGEIEKPHAPSLPQFCAKSFDFAVHLLLVQVLCEGNVEGKSSEGFCHGFGVVYRISQRS